MSAALHLSTRARDESGFTMIIALGVMFVTGLILVAAFTIANGDVRNSRRDINTKQAYYYAVAGIQQYENELQAKPNFWQNCKKVENSLKEYEEKVEHVKEPINYLVSPIPANKSAACNTSSPFATMIESKGNTPTPSAFARSARAGRSEQGRGSDAQHHRDLRGQRLPRLPLVHELRNRRPGPVRKLEQLEPHARGTLREQALLRMEKQIQLPENRMERRRDRRPVPHRRLGLRDRQRHLRASRSRTRRPGRNARRRRRQRQLRQLRRCKANYNTPTECYETGTELPLPAEDTSLKFYLESSGTYEGETWLTLEGSVMTVKKYNAKGELETKTNVAMPTTA